MLGVEKFGLARRIAEKIGVEEVDVVEDRPGFDMVRVLQQLGVNTMRGQSSIGEVCDRFLAFTQVLPKFGDASRSGKASGHADDCNLRVRGVRLRHVTLLVCAGCAVRVEAL